MKGIKRNSKLAALPESYFFSKLEACRAAAGEGVISLGVGDTTQPVPDPVLKAIHLQLEKLSVPESFSGYGPPEGNAMLRKAIAKVICRNTVTPDEVFVSDGAKGDIARLQWLFSEQTVVGIPDPVYPQYVDVSLLSGKMIRFLPCRPEDDFFPNLSLLQEVDLLYFCAPNNPTGVMATREQLENLIAAAIEHRVVIIFDTAYWSFIRDSSIPESIYQLPGAEQVIIEVGSFSKAIGFTGVRAGWTVVPKALLFSGGSSLHSDWVKIVNVTHNGSSILSQQGALAALGEEGQQAMRSLTDYYLHNAAMIRELLESLEVSFFGGENCPYIWAHFPESDSWTIFQQILDNAKVMTTPGAGFGAEGGHYVRFSGFCQRNQLLQACERLRKCLGNKRKVTGSISNC